MPAARPTNVLVASTVSSASQNDGTPCLSTSAET